MFGPLSQLLTQLSRRCFARQAKVICQPSRAGTRDGLRSVRGSQGRAGVRDFDQLLYSLRFMMETAWNRPLGT